MIISWNAANPAHAPYKVNNVYSFRIIHNGQAKRMHVPRSEILCMKLKAGVADIRDGFYDMKFKELFEND